MKFSEFDLEEIWSRYIQLSVKTCGDDPFDDEGGDELEISMHHFLLTWNTLLAPLSFLTLAELGPNILRAEARRCFGSSPNRQVAQGLLYLSVALSGANLSISFPLTERLSLILRQLAKEYQTPD